MSEQRQVGPAMWGGRRLPGDPAARPRPAPAPRPGPEPWDLAALVALVVGAVLAPAGAFVEWGVGGGLLTCGAVALLVAVLFGFGER